jgi:ribosomal protein S12 methylthiotransferase accessory factor
MLEDLFSPLTGPVSYLSQVDLPPGSPDVFVAVSRGPLPVTEGSADGEVIGSGAGLTESAAANAALGEFIERYCAADVDEEDLWIASAQEMSAAGEHVDTDSWELFTAQQLEQLPYSPLLPDTRIAWVKGTSLVTGLSTWVPAAQTFLANSTTFDIDGAVRLGPSVSTGCACGPTLRSALTSGLLELIERDAFMIVWRNMLSCPSIRIDPASSLYEVYRERFDRPHLDYALWLTTIDFPVTSVFGVLTVQGSQRGMICGGAAHTSPSNAVLKTLVELVQGYSWLEHLGGSTPALTDHAGTPRDFGQRARYYADGTRCGALSFLANLGEIVHLSDLEARCMTHEPQVEALAEMFASRGFNPSAVRLGGPDIREADAEVVRCIVPGLATMEGDDRMRFLGGTRWRKLSPELASRSHLAESGSCNPDPHPYP